MSAGDVENSDNEEILKPLKYALKQIYIVLSSFLDENSLKIMLEGTASENDNDTEAPIDEIEAIVAESSKANEVHTSNGVSSPTKEKENEKLMKVLDNLKEGSVDSICPHEHTVHQGGVFKLLKHFVKNMVIFR
uniref:Uncharacterized protein n=1 Tax=Meloidogyne hapla TaxID=6305 RepID=A0A1I8BFI1_MELHA